MSTCFKAIGVMMILFGALDFGLQALGISIFKIIGITPWWMIGRYTFAFAMAYGVLTFFVAGYLKRQRDPDVTIVDMSDPFITADAHYVTKAQPEHGMSWELGTALKALLWGGGIALAFLLLFVKFVPGMEALLFPLSSEPLTAQMRRTLVTGAVLAVFLPSVFGFFALRLRDAVSVTAMVAGWLVTSILFGVAVIEHPDLGQTVYGERFMAGLYRELGHEGGLPPGWSLERAVIFRLERAERGF
ncbi:MAG: hypothetical protein AAF672_04085 [Pseudomonadota bacterium]